jgi:hypothetical protein
MNETKVMQVNWFLNFMNLKVPNLSESDRLKWISEALYMVEFGLPYFQPITYFRSDTSHSYMKIAQWDKENKLERCHIVLKEFFKKLMENIEKLTSQREEWVPHNKTGFGNIFAAFDKKIRLIIQAPILAGIEQKTIKKGTRKGKRYLRINRDKLYDSALHVSFLTELEEESLLLTLCRSLESIKVGSLRSCPECGNWFLHTKKTKKVYCSNHCAARKTSRERRRKLRKYDPEAYEQMLAEGAKRARKSYEKKRKKENPNYKKLAIRRRPTKYKD